MEDRSGKGIGGCTGRMESGDGRGKGIGGM